MADELKLLLDATEGEGPSPEFVERLFDRLESDWDHAVGVASDGQLDHLSQDVSLAPDSPEQRDDVSRWQYLVFAAAAVALILGIGVVARSNDNDNSLETIATQPERLPTSTAFPAPTALPAPTATAVTTTGENVLATGLPLVDDFAFLDTGAYVSDALGTPIGFELAEPVLVRRNSLGQMRLAAPDTADAPGDRLISIARLSALADPTNPTLGLRSLDDGWPANDFDGWLDNLVEGIAVSDRRATMVGGREALRADLDPAKIECETYPCAFLGTNRLADWLLLHKPARYRIWLIDQSPYNPIAIMAADDDPDSESWFQFADQVVATIVFGDTAPNPIQAYGPGDVELPVLGGVHTNLVQPFALYADHRGFDSARFLGPQTRIDFIVNPLNFGDERLESSEALIETLRRAGLALEARDAIFIDGLEAEVFDLTGSAGWPILRLEPQAANGWSVGTSAMGRVWVLDHPERGLLMVGAFGDGASASDTAEVIELAEDVLRDLAFVVPG